VAFNMRVSLSAVAACAAGVLVAAPVMSQIEPPEGMRQVDLRLHALTNATVVTKPGESHEGMTVILREGLIHAIGSADAITIPPGSRLWDCTGRTIYAGLIESAMLVDPGEIVEGPGSHWNRQIHPEILASEREVPTDAAAKELRDLGFTTAAVYPEGGIWRGSGVVLSLTGDAHEPMVFRDRGFMAAGFDRGGGYPGSLMGSIAAMRQALYDAQWYLGARDVWRANPDTTVAPERNDALAALEDVLAKKQLVLFEASDEHNVLRVARIIDEFDLDAMILGSGYEFRRLGEVVEVGLPLIVPVNYPERPDVSTLSAADRATLRDLMTWEQAPTNLRRLIGAGAEVAVTTNDLRRKGDFYTNLRLAIHNGLDKNAALAAITTTPAKLLGIDHLVGTVEKGKVADLIVTDGDLFGKDTKILDVWVDGHRYEINEVDDSAKYKGTGLLRVTPTSAEPIETTIRIDTEKKSVEVDLPDGESTKAKSVSFDGERLTFVIDGRLFGANGWVQVSSTLIDEEFTGTGALPDLSRFTFTITPTETEANEESEEESAVGDPGEEDADRSGRSRNAEGAEADADPISGEWGASLISEQMGGELPFLLTMKLGEGGTVTGTVESEFFTADLEDGSFNEATGDLRATVTGGGMTSTIAATVNDNQLNGTLQSDVMRAEISASREIAVAARGESRGRGRRSDFDESDLAPEELVFPLGAYGLKEPPQNQNVLLTNATIWTCSEQGIIESGWILVRDGKIDRVGAGNYRGPMTSNVEIIDCGGKHITPGLLDCHSHTGIDGGVNEGSQAVTAEVRIGDCIDPDDINWYRQLAGGLTAANQLHGSANPIGGQNSVVKLKWGSSAEDMRIADAIPGIKFALGENVKRSQGRYPNTRMGVETLIRDSFQRAADYRAEWTRYNELGIDERSKMIPPRRDLELDTLVEILEGKRLVHCHSYRQDEILALLRTAESFGFTVGTLQHILEGYKIAEAIRDHGAGASTFSDWWAYKMEVMDAIPYNGALMEEVGVVVSFNSDSSELARRMNTEAAKAVRYGGLSPESALKFVTLNPAKQLRIDHRIGSLEPGKDADFVIWSGDPLSTYTRCEQTWIEGACYFSLEKDQELRTWTNSERQRLIQKILAKEHGESEDNAETPKSQSAETAEEPDSDGILGFEASLPF